MPKVGFRLEEQRADVRSDEVVLRLVADDQAGESAELISLIPRIPEGANLIEVKGTSEQQRREKTRLLCRALTLLLQERMVSELREYKRKRGGRWEILDELQKLFFFVFPLLRSADDSIETEAYKITVEDISQANDAYEKWFRDSDLEDPRRKSFESKLEQLSNLEAPAADHPSTSVATIEPNVPFHSTIIVGFRRGLASQRTYSVAIDAIYRLGPETYTESVTTSVAISPRPTVLSVIAILSSLLGVTLKFSLESVSLSLLPSLFVRELLSQFATTPGIPAMIIAFVVFNVYEYTEFAKRLPMGVGWQSALLIGVLSGLLGDRMIAGIKAFAGM